MSSTNGQRPAPSVEDIEPSYWFCRDLAHLWTGYDVRISKKLGQIERVLRCGRCRTLRIQTLDLDGYILRSRYQYPEQQSADAVPYVIKGIGRLDVSDRAAMRLLSTARMRGHDAPKEPTRGEAKPYPARLGTGYVCR